MTELSSHMDTIEDALADGNVELASSTLVGAFGEHPNAAELNVLKAEIALEEEDYEGSLSLCDEALKSVEDLEWKARAFSCKGYASFYNDDFENARTYFNAAVGYDADLLNAITGRAMVHEHLGFDNAAMLDLDRVIDADDQDGQPFAIRGAIQVRLGNIEIAEGDLHHAVQMDPEDEESRLNLARIHALHQRTGPAMEALGWLVDNGELAECVAPGAILRSQLSLLSMANEAALEDAERAISFIPDEPWGYLQAAASIIAHGVDGGKAIALLKQAESKVSNPRDLPDLWSLRASAYEIMGKEERAKALRLDTEGSARLPGYVYGFLNPVQNIPINPNKPVDVRALLDDLFGEAKRAPEGYEGVIRQILEQLPEIVKQHPGVGTLNIDLPEAPGMIGGKRQLVLNVNQNA